MITDLKQFAEECRRQNRRDTVKSYLITCGPPILIGIGIVILAIVR